MNLSNSKEGLCSCRCLMTLYGENEETERNVLRILSKMENMLENSSKDVGHLWGLEAKRNGMEPILTNRTGMILNFAESGHPVFRATSALERGELLEARGGSSDGETEVLEGDAQAASFLQLCEWQQVSLGNPRFFGVTQSQGMVGQFVEVAESCHPTTMSTTALFK